LLLVLLILVLQLPVVLLMLLLLLLLALLVLLFAPHLLGRRRRLQWVWTNIALPPPLLLLFQLVLSRHGIQDGIVVVVFGGVFVGTTTAVCLSLEGGNGCVGPAVAANDVVWCRRRRRRYHRRRLCRRRRGRRRRYTSHAAHRRSGPAVPHGVPHHAAQSPCQAASPGVVEENSVLLGTATRKAVQCV
jgi:hypothetical protein